MEILQRTANRGSISTATSYDIDNSIKFETANTESLTKSQTASNRKTWTLSFWFKRTKVDTDLQYVFEAGSTGSTLFSGPIINGTADWRIYDYISGSRKLAFHSTVPLNDPSAWYHMVIACDTTQSTEANRFKIYLNGVNVTAISGYFSTAAYPAQDYESNINWSSSSLSIGKAPTASTNFCGYMCEFNFIDGLMKEASDFGEFDSSGIWKPKEYTGSYGNQGYFLNFADSANLGDDASGNGKNFTENNITAADQSTDTCTNNFCTMNVLKGGINLSGTVYNRLPLMTEGATVVGNNSTNYTFLEATMGVTSGKWYWEMKPTVDANTLVSGAGIATNTNLGFSSTDGVGNFVYHYDGNRYVNGGATGYGAAWATNDIIGFAYDADNWTLTCYINNSSQGNLLASQADLSAEIVIPYMYSYGTHTYQWNFGGYTIMSNSHTNTDANGYGSFVYAPPSGYYALCTKNLAEYG